jgi:hypothetical protein
MFNSRHPGVVMFSLADGSIRTVKHVGTTGATYDAYVSTSGMADGRVVDPNAF